MREVGRSRAKSLGQSVTEEYLKSTLHKMQCQSPLVLDVCVVDRYEVLLDVVVGNEVLLGKMVFSKMVSLKEISGSHGYRTETWVF